MDSRELSEVYFNIGNTLISIRGKEREAINNFGHSARILERRLKKIMGDNSNNPNLEEIKETDANLNNRELVKKNEADSEDVKELKDVLSSVYDKV